MCRMHDCSIHFWRPERRRLLLGLTLAAAALPGAARAQSGSFHDVLPGWIGLIAAPGRERSATDAIMRAQSGWTRGALGMLTRRAGNGSPRRLVACAIDRAAYTVTEITAAGYLRVHNAEPGRQHPLWDQFHEGQRVLVQRRDGTVQPGVFAVRSNHLWRRRPQQDALVTADDLWLDVGASSASAVAALGIRILDPVVRELPAWSYGDARDSYVAGPSAVARTGCAAVAALSGNAPSSGENVYVIATQGSFTNAGISAAIARVGPVDEVIIAGGQVGMDTGAVTTAITTATSRASRSLDRSSTIGVRARFAGSLMESVRASDADAFAAALAVAVAVPASAIHPVALPLPPAPTATMLRRDAVSDVAAMMARLTNLYAVSGHEEPVRAAVLASLPAWAQSRATTDSAGNLVLPLGPDRDTAVVMAHMDEIGFVVTRIAHDGTLTLRTHGSFYPSLWEGQPALLHLDVAQPSARVGGECAEASGSSLRGVFVPRDSAVHKQPTTSTAWFGLDSAALVARGAKIGSTLTGYKCATRLAGTRFSARSIDDRAGVTALLMAVARIDPAKLTHKTLLVWSVREEGGLEGAGAAAALFGPTIHRVHAVDTFVSSDSPVEDRRFGYAPLGEGAVVRALDNSSATPPEEVDRLLELARSRQIPLRFGVTNGGNDGSQLVRFGAVNVPFSWPLRYSHSPAEVADLRDISAMADLTRAIIEDRGSRVEDRRP
ncbi:MAG: hypothetical protein JWN53_1359 [Gemmatimonadetes bacterium]|nr:hypothetical protein [Gemmatimonadota bacterium]